MPLQDNFIGTWTLKEWSVTHLASDQKHYPFAGNCAGHIIYTADGWISATLMDTQRQPVEQERFQLIGAKNQLLKNEWPEAGTDTQELVRRYALAAMGYVSYTGRYVVEGDQVRHQVQDSNIPQWPGVTLTRDFVFEEDCLILTAEQEGFLDQLVWQR
jgi:hypothetical protein